MNWKFVWRFLIRAALQLKQRSSHCQCYQAIIDLKIARLSSSQGRESFDEENSWNLLEQQAWFHDQIITKFTNSRWSSGCPSNDQKIDVSIYSNFQFFQHQRICSRDVLRWWIWMFFYQSIEFLLLFLFSWRKKLQKNKNKKYFNQEWKVSDILGQHLRNKCLEKDSLVRKVHPKVVRHWILLRHLLSENCCCFISKVLLGFNAILLLFFANHSFPTNKFYGCSFVLVFFHFFGNNNIYSFKYTISPWVT